MLHAERIETSVTASQFPYLALVLSDATGLHCVDCNDNLHEDMLQYFGLRTFHVWYPCFLHFHLTLLNYWYCFIRKRVNVYHIRIPASVDCKKMLTVIIWPPTEFKEITPQWRQRVDKVHYKP